MFVPPFLFILLPLFASCVWCISPHPATGAFAGESQFVLLGIDSPAATAAPKVDGRQAETGEQAGPAVSSPPAEEAAAAAGGGDSDDDDDAPPMVEMAAAVAAACGSRGGSSSSSSSDDGEIAAPAPPQWSESRQLLEELIKAECKGDGKAVTGISQVGVGGWEGEGEGGGEGSRGGLTGLSLGRRFRREVSGDCCSLYHKLTAQNYTAGAAAARVSGHCCLLYCASFRTLLSPVLRTYVPVPQPYRRCGSCASAWTGSTST